MNNLILTDNLSLNYSDLTNTFIKNHSPPIRGDWNYEQKVIRSKIKVWELIYDDPYNFGLYVSWNPYIEYYLIVFYNFSSDLKRYHDFYGPDSFAQIKNYLERCDIKIDIQEIN